MVDQLDFIVSRSTQRILADHEAWCVYSTGSCLSCTVLFIPLLCVALGEVVRRHLVQLCRGSLHETAVGGNGQLHVSREQEQEEGSQRVS